MFDTHRIARSLRMPSLTPAQDSVAPDMLDARLATLALRLIE